MGSLSAWRNVELHAVDAGLFYETTNKEEAEMDVGNAQVGVSGLFSAVGMAMLPPRTGNVHHAEH